MTNEHIRSIRVKKHHFGAKFKINFPRENTYFCSFESKNLFFEFCAKMIIF